MILYDFKCNECGVFEKLVKPEQREVQCSCGSTATRVVSTPSISLDGCSGDFPGEALKWERKHTPKSRGGDAPEITYY